MKKQNLTYEKAGGIILVLLLIFSASFVFAQLTEKSGDWQAISTQIDNDKGVSLATTDPASIVQFLQASPDRITSLDPKVFSNADIANQATQTLIDKPELIDTTSKESLLAIQDKKPTAIADILEKNPDKLNAIDSEVVLKAEENNKGTIMKAMKAKPTTISNANKEVFMKGVEGDTAGIKAVPEVKKKLTDLAGSDSNIVKDTTKYPGVRKALFDSYGTTVSDDVNIKGFAEGRIETDKGFYNINQMQTAEFTGTVAKDGTLKVKDGPTINPEKGTVEFAKGTKENNAGISVTGSKATVDMSDGTAKYDLTLKNGAKAKMPGIEDQSYKSTTGKEVKLTKQKDSYLVKGDNSEFYNGDTKELSFTGQMNNKDGALVIKDKAEFTKYSTDGKKLGDYAITGGDASYLGSVDEPVTGNFVQIGDQGQLTANMDNGVLTAKSLPTGQKWAVTANSKATVELTNADGVGVKVINGDRYYSQRGEGDSCLRNDYEVTTMTADGKITTYTHDYTAGTYLRAGTIKAVTTKADGQLVVYNGNENRGILRSLKSTGFETPAAQKVADKVADLENEFQLVDDLDIPANVEKSAFPDTETQVASEAQPGTAEYAKAKVEIAKKAEADYDTATTDKDAKLKIFKDAQTEAKEAFEEAYGPLSEETAAPAEEQVTTSEEVAPTTEEAPAETTETPTVEPVKTEEAAKPAEAYSVPDTITQKSLTSSSVFKKAMGTPDENGIYTYRAEGSDLPIYIKNDMGTWKWSPDPNKYAWQTSLASPVEYAYLDTKSIKLMEYLRYYNAPAVDTANLQQQLVSLKQAATPTVTQSLESVSALSNLLAQMQAAGISIGNNNCPKEYTWDKTKKQCIATTKAA